MESIIIKAANTTCLAFTDRITCVIVIVIVIVIKVIVKKTIVIKTTVIKVMVIVITVTVIMIVIVIYLSEAERKALMTYSMIMRRSERNARMKNS